MRLVDTVQCVVCEKREYQLSAGKSSRTFQAVCASCEPAFVAGQQEKFYAENASKPKGKSQ